MSDDDQPEHITSDDDRLQSPPFLELQDPSDNDPPQSTNSGRSQKGDCAIDIGHFELDTHKDEARIKSKEQATQDQELLDIEAINARDIDVSKVLSRLSVTLREIRNSLGGLYENFLVYTSNLTKLSTDEIPYGFPKDCITCQQSGYRHLAGSMAGMRSEMDDIADKLAPFEKDLILARRDHESVIRELRKWYDHLRVA